jgi:DNA-binding GntR family transcriptional regulator
MPQRHTSPALRKIAPNLMVEYKLRPGTKLREDIIGETFGVSRTTVRKVLQILEQEGIIHLPVNRGAYVASPSPGETQAVLEIYLMVVRHLARALASKQKPISAEQRSLIDQHIKAQEEAEKARDYVTARILSSEFIILLSAVHGNFLLIRQAAELCGRIALCLALYQAEHVYLDRAPIHRNILGLIESNKADEAVAAFEAAFHATEKTLRFDPDGLEVDLASILGSPSKTNSTKDASPKAASTKAASTKVTSSKNVSPKTAAPAVKATRKRAAKT